ncbi:uncharacterized protein RAG0_00863 [Rhynchosporium agropyri]|uniref:RRM domain-containing protein n=1 Tax=Rhynchosporium agropyri TaxID=914238 RepID=A0A1E1JUB6_9HELO|nr:uncharacterized protein RAG0_00863 [Rhynchosporium agropyri]
MPFHPHPHPHPHLQSVMALTPIPETRTPSIFVAPPSMPIMTSPLRQLRAPPVPFVPKPSTSMPPASNEVTMDFYYPPPHTPAIFSTKYCTRHKRELVAPFPTAVVRSNMKDDVEARASQLIEEFPFAREIVDVSGDWYDLHQFFDGYDLWVEGARFCYMVMFVLCRKNTEHREIRNAQMAIIDEFAMQWITSNQSVVLYNPSVYPMTALIPIDDQLEFEFHDMTLEQIQFLNERLDYHRQVLLHANATPPRQQLTNNRHHMLPQHFQPLQPAVPIPVNVLGRAQYPQNTLPHSTRVLDPSLPQVHRAHHDPGMSLVHRPVNGQESMPRGSLQGEDPSSFSQQFTELIFLGRQSHGHSSIIDTRRQVTPTGYQNQAHPRGFNNEHGNVRPRGFSNSSQYARAFHGNIQRHASDALRGGSSGNITTPPREAVYVRNISPRDNGPVSVGNRVVSAPTPGVTFYPAGRITSGGHSQLLSTADRGTYSHNTRVGITSYPWTERHMANDTMTTHYLPGPRDYDGLRTIMVTGLDSDMVFSHSLKDMMEECGTINSIHYMPASPRAFIMFVESSSVQRAIARFNRVTLPSGHKLLVSVPDQKHHSRSGSNTSQHHRGGAYNFAGRIESRSRRSSIRTIADVVQHHSQVMSPADRVMYSNDARVGMPLSSIENVQNANKRRIASPRKLQQGITPTRNNTKKENMSPTKKAGAVDTGENISPRKYTSSDKRSNKRGRGSKQNTSTHPTPAVTPIKSMSSTDLQDIKNLQVIADSLKMKSSNGGCSLRSTANENDFKSAFHDSSKSDASQLTDAVSDATLSPAKSAPTTRDTSFSAMSSRKQSESSQVTKSQGDMNNSSFTLGATTSKNTSKKPYKSRFKKQHVSTDKQDINSGEGTNAAPEDFEKADDSPVKTTQETSIFIAPEIKPVVPVVAVPRAFEAQSRPFHDHVLDFNLGTETWPFVRRFKGR